jgi:hypothetical protein
MTNLFCLLLSKVVCPSKGVIGKNGVLEDIRKNRSGKMHTPDNSTP